MGALAPESLRESDIRCVNVEQAKIAGSSIAEAVLNAGRSSHIAPLPGEEGRAADRVLGFPLSTKNESTWSS